MESLLESTAAVSKGLETLRAEHVSLLEELKTAEHQEEIEGHVDDDIEGMEGVGAQLKEEKETALNESMEKLAVGIGEAKLMLTLATYINILEADKQKLKAQVKRLCAENNWLRKELTDHQQLLQETETSLAKIKEEKEHLGFLLEQQRQEREQREQSPAMDIDTQEEESEGVIQNSSGVVSHSDSQQEGYEVPENFKTLHHLALQYVNQGKPDVAVPLCKKALRDLEQKKGRDNPDVAAMLNIMAVIYREQGKLKEATKVLHDTLEIREKVYGLHHPAVASTLNNLSVLYGKCGDFKAAEPFCKKALEIRQSLVGANHPDVAKQYTNLAILCSHLGKYEEVEYYYERALEIYQTELGSDDPNVAKTLNNLANCYLKQGKYKAAETIFKKVLSTVQTSERTGESEESRSPGHVSSWMLGGTPETPSSWSKKGKEELYHEKGGWHKAAPVHSPTVSSTLRGLSTAYREQGREETAKELEKLTKEEVLDQAQQDRVKELIAEEASSSPDRPATPSKNQGLRRSRSMKLSQSVRKLLRLDPSGGQ